MCIWVERSVLFWGDSAIIYEWVFPIVVLLVKQELPSLQEHSSSTHFFCEFRVVPSLFYCVVFCGLFCVFFVLFRLVIVLSILQLTNSDIFGIFTLFFTFFLYLLMSYYILFIYPWSMLNNRNRQYKQPQQHEPPIWQQEPPFWQQEPPIWQQEPPIWQHEPPIWQQEPPIWHGM
jgi:hypothetical protein